MKIVIEVHTLSYLLYDMVYIIYTGYAFPREPMYAFFPPYITETLKFAPDMGQSKSNFSGDIMMQFNIPT